MYLLSPKQIGYVYADTTGYHAIVYYQRPDEAIETPSQSLKRGVGADPIVKQEILSHHRLLILEPHKRNRARTLVIITSFRLDLPFTAKRERGSLLLGHLYYLPSGGWTTA